MVQEYFSVQVSDTVRVGVPIADVEGVLQLHQQEICPIPGVNPFLLGVINQRGYLVWVLQLSELLGLSYSAGVGRVLVPAVLLGIKTNSREAPLKRRIACVVAELEGIISFDSQQIQPLPANLKPQIHAVATGIAYKEGLPTMVVLDSFALFSTIRSKSSTTLLL